MGKIFDGINSKIMEAMKAGEPSRANAYRNIKAKMLEFKTAKNASPLDDLAEITIIKKMVSELKADAKLFNDNGRKDIAQERELECSFIEPFLPKEASAEEINNEVEKFISELGKPLTKAEMGLCIKTVKSAFENADGKLVSDIVRKHIQ